MTADDDPFARCLPVTLREETGERQVWGKPIVRGRWSYLDHKRDPGGATMCGVTAAIQAAIDAAGTTGGASCRLLAGPNTSRLLDCDDRNWHDRDLLRAA